MGKSYINFPIKALKVKEITAKGDFWYDSGDYKLAVQFAGSGRIGVKKHMTGMMPFGQAEEEFAKVKRGQDIKILFAGPNEKSSQ